MQDALVKPPFFSMYPERWRALDVKPGLDQLDVTLALYEWSIKLPIAARYARPVRPSDGSK